MNRKPILGIQADAGLFLQQLATQSGASKGEKWRTWHESLQVRDRERDTEIDQQAQEPTAHVNPVQLCQTLERIIPEDSLILGDGGDFVGTASYIIRPRPTYLA